MLFCITQIRTNKKKINFELRKFALKNKIPTFNKQKQKVCGNRNYLRRFRIIPLCYLKYLPENIKRFSNDFVLMCSQCEAKANQSFKKFVCKLNKDYNIMDVKNIIKMEINQSIGIQKYEKMLEISKIGHIYSSKIKNMCNFEKKNEFLLKIAKYHSIDLNNIKQNEWNHVILNDLIAETRDLAAHTP